VSSQAPSTGAAARDVHLFNEVQPLKELLVWGEPGCETLLGQLLPKSRSLFFSYYEIPQARQEFRHMQELLRGAGVEVVRVKDAYARMLKPGDFQDLPATLRALERRLLERADLFYETYLPERKADLKADGLQLSPAQVFEQVRNDIHQVLEQDAATYGEQAAIRLNQVLSLSRELPISNLFYGRDQSNAIGDRIVLSAMRWEIRKPEVEIYEQALRGMGYGDILVKVGRGTFEGGDAILFGDTCYIGVGARTSLEAVSDLYRQMGRELEAQGIHMVAIINQKHAEETPHSENPADEHMRVMHLDMFWSPLDEGSVLAYGQEIDDRRVLEITPGEGTPVYRDTGSFREYLLARGLEIIEISEQEQHNFAANLVNLGDHRILVPLSTNYRVLAELKQRGYDILEAEIHKLVGGYGAVHCLTAPVRRG
jgi:arginine deiminase